jgi:hypothetical protein
MSVLVTGTFHGNTATFRQALVDRADDFAKFAELSQTDGAIHHRFGVGDGVVVIVDEWQTPADFERFFSRPDLQAFIAEIGADPGAAPEIVVTEAVSSPDQF